MNVQDLDSTARRVLRLAEPEICRHLGLSHLGPQLVSALYLEVRATLVQIDPDPRAPGDAAEELAMASYLTVLSETETPGPELIAGLKRTIARALGSEDDHPQASPRRSTADRSGRS